MFNGTLRAQLEEVLDARTGVLAKRFERQQVESRDRVFNQTEKSIKRLNDEMMHRMSGRLGDEAKRIEEEVERRVGSRSARTCRSRPREARCTDGARDRR